MIIEELRQRNNAQFRVGNKAAISVFGDTRYAHRNMLGTEEFLRTFDSQMLEILQVLVSSGFTGRGNCR